MSLLSELLVQGGRKGLSSGLSKAAGSALGAYVGKALGGAGGGGSSASTDLIRYLGTQGVQPPTTVAPVDVAGAPQVPTGALGQVLANAALAGGAGADEIQGVDVQGQKAQQDPTAEAAGQAAAAALTSSPADISAVDVVAPKKAALPSVEAAAPIVPAALANLTTMPDSLDLTQPETLQPAPEPQGIPPALALLPAVGAIAGLAGPGPAGADITPPSDGGGGLLGPIDIKDLIGAGILGTSLLANGGGGASGTGDLKSLADQNAALAGRLGNISDAGFQGNIGGKGLNAIKRMVQKAQAAIRQRYAAMGMSGSTAENQDLQAAAESGVDLQFKIGQEMAQTGLNAIAALTGQSATIYASLLNAQTAKNTALGNALANFAASVVR